MTDLTLILGAVLLAAAGGEAFLKSILGAALHLRVPKVVVATTLAAFATSSPELTVSSWKPQLTACIPMRSPMNADFSPSARHHPMGERATHPLARPTAVSRFIGRRAGGTAGNRPRRCARQQCCQYRADLRAGLAVWCDTNFASGFRPGLLPGPGDSGSDPMLFTLQSLETNRDGR